MKEINHCLIPETENEEAVSALLCAHVDMNDADPEITEKLAALLDAKDAEIARLRPAAEAWEAQEAWRFCDGRDQVLREELYKRRNGAAARARAAKGAA